MAEEDVSAENKNKRRNKIIDYEKIRQREVHRINEESKQAALQEHRIRVVRMIKDERKIRNVNAEIKWETIQ